VYASSAGGLNGSPCEPFPEFPPVVGGMGLLVCVGSGAVVVMGGAVVVLVTGGGVDVVVSTGGGTVTLVVGIVVVVVAVVVRQWFSFPSSFCPWASQSCPLSDGSGTQDAPFGWSLHPDPGSLTPADAVALASTNKAEVASRPPISSFFNFSFLSLPT